MVKRIIILILLFVAFSYSSSYVQAASSDIKYFGYYWGMDKFAGASDHVNVMFVTNEWEATEVDQLAEKDIYDFNLLAQAGSKGILDVSAVFLDMFNNYSLRPDYATRWQRYWSLLAPYKNNIVAIYPMDEPDANITPENLTIITNQIKTTLTNSGINIPILVVVTPSGVVRLRSGEISIPPAVSWLGFDEYGCWGSECFVGVSMTEKFNVIVNIMRARQGKVVLVPDGFYDKGTNLPAGYEQELAAKAVKYYELCQTAPECIGLFPFLWQSQSNVGVGTNAMPTLINQFRTIGRSIKNNSPTPKPGDFNYDNKVDILDFSLVVQRYAKPYTVYDYNLIRANFNK